MRQSFLFVTIFFSLNISYGQQDFDSLYDNSKPFKKYVKAYFDTLDFFNSNKILKITLESDFKALVKNKMNGQYQDAQITTEFNDTILVTRRVRILLAITDI